MTSTSDNPATKHAGKFYHRPRIVTLDLETVPDARLFARAAGDNADMEAARQAAEAGDANRMKEILGDDFKPGQRTKPDALLAFLETYREKWAGNIIKRHSVDPTLLAICSWAAYTRDPESDDHGATNPVAAVCSWGTVDETPQLLAPNKSASETNPTVVRFQTVDETKPLVDMSIQEQWAAERLMLLNLWGWLGQYASEFAQGTAVLATFNGFDFDLPALLWRTLRHRDLIKLVGSEIPGVRATCRFPLERYKSRPHLDVAQVVWRWDRTNRTGCGLQESLIRLGFDGFQKVHGMNGMEVYPRANEGRWNDVEEYNLGDVVDLHDAARLLLDGGMA